MIQNDMGNTPIRTAGSSLRLPSRSSSVFCTFNVKSSANKYRFPKLLLLLFTPLLQYILMRFAFAPMLFR
jgi:hypothetical protein